MEHAYTYPTPTTYPAKVINLLGAPGAGKSTLALNLTGKMKQVGIDAEIVTEYAKDCVWGNVTANLENQVYVFGKQSHRMFRLRDKVEYIVTDSPLLLCAYYNHGYWKSLEPTVLEVFHRYNNLNFFVNRTKPYNPNGRMQTEAESDAIAIEIKDFLKKYQIPYTEINSDVDPGVLLHRIQSLTLTACQDTKEIGNATC